MKKIVTLCFLLTFGLAAFTQGLGNLTGSLTGSSVTSAAANAAKQLQTLMPLSNSSNAAANSMSQLQLLGLDPAAIQKFIKAKADASTAPQEQSNPLQDVLQTVFDMKIRQDSMQAILDRNSNNNKPNNDVKPNEIFGHDFFGSGKLALCKK